MNLNPGKIVSSSDFRVNEFFLLSVTTLCSKQNIFNSPQSVSLSSGGKLYYSVCSESRISDTLVLVVEVHSAGICVVHFSVNNIETFWRGTSQLYCAGASRAAGRQRGAIQFASPVHIPMTPVNELCK